MPSAGGVRPGTLLFLSGAALGGAAGCFVGYNFHDVLKNRQRNRERKRQERKEMCEQCLATTACVCLVTIAGMIKFS